MAEGSSADDRSYRVDFSKLGTAFPDLSLDWDAERGARELADAYRAVGLTLTDFEGDRYVRLRRLESMLGASELSNDLRRGAETAPACVRLVSRLPNPIRLSFKGPDLPRWLVQTSRSGMGWAKRKDYGQRLWLRLPGLVASRLRPHMRSPHSAQVTSAGAPRPVPRC